MHYSKTLAATLACAATLSSSTLADDWPQWQGPDRNAVSKEHGLSQEWPKNGPPLAWKIKGLGGGYGAPSVAVGKIFVMGNRGDDEVVWALSEKDGQTLWSTPLGPASRQGPPQGKEGTGSTPTVDGDRVYALGLGGTLVCLQASDGKILWQKSLTRDLGGKVPAWRYNESPLIDGDKLICTPGGEDALLVALDKMTGNTIWKSQVPSGSTGGGAERGDGPPGGGPGRRGRGAGGGAGASYASAIVIDVDGQRQYVQFTAKALVGVAAADGKFLWRYTHPANPMGINCSTPVYHDGMVLAASAYGAGGGLVKLIKEAGGGFKAEEVWFSKKMQNHHGGMIVVDDAVFGANGGNEGGALVCLDFKTGKVLWDERDDPEHRAPKGSLAMADGRLYYRTEAGPVLLLEPNAKQYTEKGRFDQPERSSQPAWPHPVIANGKLYLRDQDALFCYDVKAK